MKQSLRILAAAAAGCILPAGAAANSNLEPMVLAEGVTYVERGMEQSAPRDARATFTTVPLELFNLAAPEVPGFARVRADRPGSFIRVRPNADTANNSFGWIEAPAIPAFGGGGSEGDQLAVRVRYNRPTSFVGTPPTLRVRLHRSDFSIYAQAGQSPADVQAGTSGEVKVYFDRNRLPTGHNNLFLFIDLLAVEPGQTIDPNFEFQITEVAYATLNATSVEPSEVFTAVYGEDDGDIYAHVNGSTSRTRVRETAARHCWNKQWVAVIDSENLYAYSAQTPANEITVESSLNVVSAALAGFHVVFLTDDGEVYIQNLQNQARRRIVTSGADGVGSADDGRTVLILDRTSFSGFDLLSLDTGVNNSGVLELVTDNDVDALRGRATTHY